MSHFDLIVIGGGSGGFAAARTAHAFGRSVAIVDGARQLGGLCILRGCMPSKTLLYMAEVLHLAGKGSVFGLNIPHASADMAAMHARKVKIISEFAGFREQQLNSGKYTIFRATARFEDDHTIALSTGERLTADRFVVATGSTVAVPPIPGLSETPAWTSDDVLDLDFVPESVIVLGGGIVACELAQFLRRIGTRVTLIQRSPNILRDHSGQASSVIQQAFRDEGIELFTQTRIQRVRSEGKTVRVEFTEKDRTQTRSAAFLFNALGRVPAVASLQLDRAGVAVNEEGRIVTTDFQQTTQPHIYAAGDVCGPFDIVHLAISQGELAARHAFGFRNLTPIDPTLLLNIVFTDPQLATIGVLERDLLEKDQPYLSASYPFNDHGKSILMDANHGYVKVLASPADGRILGAEIVGPSAGELIHVFSTPLAMKATVFDMLKAPWYHPTLAEIVTYPLEEIAEAVNQRD